MTKNMLLYLIIVVFILSCINIYGQKKEITKDEYNQSFRMAQQKGSKISRRLVSQQENFRDGNPSSSEEYIYEYLLPDKMYYSHKEVFPNKTQKIEQIQIGESYYCRRNDEVWKQSKSWCADGSAFGLPNIISSKFTIEEIEIEKKKSRLYQQYVIYKNIYSPNKDKEGMSYWQTKFWLNEDGLIVKKESENGLLEPRQLRWKQFETYEYNPKGLKIEAPIK